MSLTRIYQPISLAIGQSVLITGKSAHRIMHVLRARISDHITLFNGEGGEYDCEITHIDKKTVTAHVLQFIDRDVESPLYLHLAQGLARGEKMDFIVQKAVELGVNEITPLLTARSNVKLYQEREEKRLTHWQSVMVSACEQSGRCRIPTINKPILLTEWLSHAKADYCFVLSPERKEKLPKEEIVKYPKIILLIGPEGGFSEDEMQDAIQHGFSPLLLGPRILRTETASIAALASLQCRYGDF